MNYFCSGYTLNNKEYNCAVEANSWGYFHQCDHCYSKSRKEECDNSYCEELGAKHPKN